MTLSVRGWEALEASVLPVLPSSLPVGASFPLSLSFLGVGARDAGLGAWLGTIHISTCLLSQQL